MGIHDKVVDEATPRREQRCTECRAVMHFSHVEYAGRGLEAVVMRCPACGAVARGQPRPRRQQAPGRSKRRERAPVDEGPPSNPVIDPEMARRLLEGG